MAEVDPPDERIRRTLRHYEVNAESFWQGTRDHDVAQNLEALLAAIEGAAPFEILDLGCGPGRDLQALDACGHNATGVEGCDAFVAMAQQHAPRAKILHQSFASLDLPGAFFDGIFANASLFHVPTLQLPRVLEDLHHALKPRGVLFSSNPRGQNQEGFAGDRWGAYHDLDAWSAYLKRASFVIEHTYYRPAGLPRDQQNWLCCVARKQ